MAKKQNIYRCKKDTLKVLHNVMRNGSSTGHTHANAFGRVFENNALGSVVPKTFGSKEEGIGSWLSWFEVLIVSSDSYGLGCNPNVCHITIS